MKRLSAALLLVLWKNKVIDIESQSTKLSVEFVPNWSRLRAQVRGSGFGRVRVCFDAGLGLSIITYYILHITP